MHAMQPRAGPTFLLLAACAAAGSLYAAHAQSISQYIPPRTGLQIVTAGALRTATSYPCEYDSSKTCYGIHHVEALFGVPKYGSELTLNVYDATPSPADDGCPTADNPAPYTAQASWQAPFALLVDRGDCHFTAKVRYAQSVGAEGVIIVDNHALRTDPRGVCPNFMTPMHRASSGSSWVPCTGALQADQCRCPSDYTVAPKAIPAVPRCPLRNARPTYQTTCENDSGKSCWVCVGTSSSSTDKTYYPEACTTNCDIESLLPFMSDDSSGGDITIPSFMVSDYWGNMLREAIKTAPQLSGLRIRMQWEIKTRDKVEYELWTSCEDRNGGEFKRDFMETAMRLADYTIFTPRYYIYDGARLGCTASSQPCGSQCIGRGRYCGPDPDPSGDLDSGVNGEHVVKENLRQIAMWQYLQGRATSEGNTVLSKWWCYVNDFADTCFDPDGDYMTNGETFDQCAQIVMGRHGIDAAAVDAIVTSSYSGDVNSLLAAEITYRENFGVLKLPEVVVNGVVLRGNTDYGATMELNVAEAICNGFTVAPQVCTDIYARQTVAPRGNAAVSFNLEMKTSTGSALQVSDFDAGLQSRLASTLALKLGVDPTQVVIGAASGGANAVVTSVNVNNLQCSSESSSSDAIAALIRGEAACTASASTSSQVDQEVAQEKVFTFNTKISRGNRYARQIQATVKAVANDDSLCTTGGDGVSAGIVVLIVLLIVGVFGGAFFVYYRYSQARLRAEVQSIMDRYMPLDDGEGFHDDPAVGGDAVNLIERGAEQSSSSSSA